MHLNNRSREVIRIFVASPRDVEPERRVVDDVVRELNTTWSEFLGLFVELLRWETHAYPGVSDYPQAVINDQIVEYDIFIGIMWTRLGTPTPVAGSGTEEEFDRAYSKYLQDREKIRIMLYFKTAQPPRGSDPYQLKKVVAFQDRVAEQGILSWRFTELAQLAPLLRIHLSRQLQGWYRSGAIQSQRSEERASEQTDRRAKAAESVSPNFYISSAEVLRLVLSIIDALRNLTTAVEVKTTGLNDLKRRGRITPQVVRIAIIQLSRDIEEFVLSSDEFFRSFRPHFQSALEAVSNAAPLIVDDPDSLEEWRNRIRAKLENQLFSLRHLDEQLKRASRIVSEAPQAHRSLEKSSKRLVAKLNALRVEFRHAQERTREVELIFRTRQF